jgi:hypothetical protein
MVIAVVVLIVSTVVIAAVTMLPKIQTRRLVLDTGTDGPCPFGPSMAWLAIRTHDQPGVVDALGLAEPTPANWASGVGTVYDLALGSNRVFVSPPIDGWVLAVGPGLPLPQGPLFVDKVTPFLDGLVGRFGEVQMFAAFPEIDLFCWCRVRPARTRRAVTGTPDRLFAIADSGVILDRGKTTPEERALGLHLYELRGVRGRRGDAGGELIMHPTEEHVMRLAGAWSLNPTLLTANHATANGAPGIVGLTPPGWRSECVRRRA